MTRTSQTTPLDALWQAPVIIWTLLAGEALAIVLALAQGAGDNRWIYFGLTSLVVQWVSLSTLGALYLFRRKLARLRPTWIANIALLTLIAASGLVCGAGWLLLRDLWPMAREGWLSMCLRFAGIAISVGLLGLAAFQNHWRARQLAVRAKQSELEALRARIRPHFLFNTLNAAAALVHQHPEKTERLLLDLADLFRAALSGPTEIALTEELALVRRYLEIESLRFGDRLRVEWQLPEPLPAVFVPTLSIQPLVENAIRHGVESSSSGGEIAIVVATSGHTVSVTVSNPLPAAPVSNVRGHQIGLSSVHARVQAMTHGLGQLKTATVDGRYVATISLPLDQ